MSNTQNYYLHLHKLAKHEVTMKGKILHTATLKCPLKPLQKAMIKVSRPLKTKNPKNIMRKQTNVRRYL